LKRGQQQMSLLALLSTTDRDVRVANVSSLATNPRRQRRT
jgi:hypothetical protein